MGLGTGYIEGSLRPPPCVYMGDEKNKAFWPRKERDLQPLPPQALPLLPPRACGTSSSILHTCLVRVDSVPGTVLGRAWFLPSRSLICVLNAYSLGEELASWGSGSKPIPHGKAGLRTRHSNPCACFMLISSGWSALRLLQIDHKCVRAALNRGMEAKPREIPGDWGNQHMEKGRVAGSLKDMIPHGTAGRFGLMGPRVRGAVGLLTPVVLGGPSCKERCF